MSFVYDNEMNYERAKKELGLGDSFTDAELKQAYHRLAKKYHPDPNANTDKEDEDFTERMKAINKAYKTLKGRTKNSSKTNDYGFSLEKYKKDKFEQFKSSVHYQEINGIRDLGFQFGLAKLVEEAGLKINSAENINQVDSIINAVYCAFDELLIIKVDAFCSNNGITKQEINKAFNLEVELKKRNPNQLCIKLKSALEKIKKVKIEETIQRYVGYAGYSDIKDKIDLFRQKAMNSMDNINKTVKELQQNIDDAFENYFDNMKLIDELYELTKSVDDKEILEELKELIKKVNHDDFKKRYDDLKRKIHNYNMSKELDSIFKGINQKGAEALKNCKSFHESMQAYTVFSKLLEQLKKNMTDDDQLIVTDELKNMLKLVTFKDFKNDIDILDSLEHKSNTNHGIDNIYVKVRNFANIHDKLSFFIERNGILCRISGTTYDAIVVKNEDFIPLSQFLSEVKIEDKFCEERNFSYDNCFNTIYQICTYKDGRSICLVTRDFLGVISSKIEIHDSKNLISVSKYGIKKEQHQKYIDMEYLTEAISEQVNKAFREKGSQDSEQKFLRKNKRGKIF